MRLRTQGGPGPALLALALPLAACGAGSAPSARSHELQANQHELSERVNEQSGRIAELEARIALLESEARSGRDGKDAKPTRSGDTIRIGPEPAALTAVSPAGASEPRGADDEQQPVPSYRLYGKPARAGREPLAPLPVVNETLPVVPLPEQRARDVNARPPSAGPVAEYRNALQLLKDRRFDEALKGFDALLAQNPSHPLAPKALYWRGEARYAKREYAQALREFEALLERFPESEKAPDALLKTALCFRRLGAEDKAQASFRRLRADYPNSQAALIASREGST